ncbi:MAG: glycoside hydrolase 43 family protein [Bacteroidaceae bacterium]|nr:glycoside hydrolase 43 family protein [Bacteroidaceae bacterium]
MGIKALTTAIATIATLACSAQTTCKNPMIWADVPDPDVIRVDDTYYMVSTTMHLMPGGPVYESKDLVHWSLASYLFDTLNDSPLYSLQGGTSYGRGQWATSLKYHDGMFYALFCTNDPQGGADSYIFTTRDPHQGWTLHSRIPHFHDPSLFFDDDGRVYVFHGSGNLTELRPDLKGIKEGGVNQQIIGRDKEENGLLEGSRVIKKDGKYYALMISWPQGKPRRQLCYRADRITGPYGKAVILEDNFGGFPYAAQGTIVDTPKGEWYGVIFQDHNAVGRIPLLIPVKWEEGWPMMYRVPEEFTVDTDEYEGEPIVTSDDFSKPELKHQWQWNHNPINTAWSLTERKGWLRLKTSLIVENLFAAPNTISQRMEGPTCSASVCIDISKMRDGDRAGFAAFNGHSGVLLISRDGKQATLSMQAQTVNLSDARQHDNKHAVANVEVDEKECISLQGRKIWLRIDGDFTLGKDIATFQYSTNGRQWQAIGEPFQMRFDYTRLFMGTRYAIFNYATRQTGGYIDIDYFTYNKQDK